jgi:hypothetical protein
LPVWQLLRAKLADLASFWRFLKMMDNLLPKEKYYPLITRIIPHWKPNLDKVFTYLVKV